MTLQEHSNERELPNALMQICKKALSKDAEDRYPNATAMAAELSNVELVINKSNWPQKRPSKPSS